MGVIVFGCGSHARVILQILLESGKYSVSGVISNRLKPGELVGGVPVLGTDKEFFEGKIACHKGIIGLGDNGTRKKLAEEIISHSPGFEFINSIHPHSSICSTAKIGIGTVVCAGSVIGAHSIVGNHCIINTSASVDHDNVIGNYASVMPGATTGGNVKIGDLSAICLGASVIHEITIGTNTVVGAGSVVVRDIKPNVLAMGVPATERSKREVGDKFL